MNIKKALKIFDFSAFFVIRRLDETAIIGPKILKLI